MILKHPSKLRVLLVTAFLTLFLCIVPLQARASSGYGGGAAGAAGGAAIIIVGILVIAVAVMAATCAIRASDQPGGFGECFLHGKPFSADWHASRPVQAEEQKEEDVVLNTSPVEESEPGIGAESEGTEDDATPQMEASARGDHGEE